ncbi:NAD(P)/FAD-dependent oxidoreductase [Fibrobacter sp. UWP2]|uniref:NAD(P)/FAD-dependent oxidoreductase n=1 Tax=Fibrobacter sp. UWP2 TaxID=1896216 RepID=UPI000921F1B9|nr:NAD(P)/FAD-dependent oxidoreductase [Fibrobacter sp. UWP2]SHJ13471.1 Dehydrogenase (flavoprotein) [Fibrobacter sp. UWP2]
MSDFLSKEYDAVVCGAGPAGLMAACTLGKMTRGARRVLLLDKKAPWKEPIFCAEAASTSRLGALWPIDRSWVRGPISGIYFTSPKGYRAEFYSKDCGCLLDRSKFHHALAVGCKDAGVECHFDTVVKKLERVDNGWNIVVGNGDYDETLFSKVVVDSTGPGCRLTRDIDCLKGIESGDTDLEPAIFALAEGIEHSREHIELFFGSDFPEGYGWIFPRDGVEVNIGFVLGKNAKSGISMRQKLEAFVARYPGAKIRAVYGGMIACGQSKKPIAKCGLFKAGDAASCVNPISRSGITESLLCGKIVAECAVEWLKSTSAEDREQIEAMAFTRWMDAMGKSHLQVARAKKAFYSVKDSQFDRAAERLSKLPRQKQTLYRIFFNVLWACPSLIWKMRSFFHW